MSPKHVCFNTLFVASKKLMWNIDKNLEPSTYEESTSIHEWQEAMTKEFEALEANNTWKIMDLPKGMKPICCK